MALVVGVTMVKDEEDVIATSVGWMLDQVDAVIVADNRSTDRTREILDGLNGGRDIIVIDDPEPAYRQSEKMTRLARRAHDGFGADWIVPFDADEVWRSTDGRTISATLADVDADVLVAEAVLYDHVATGLDDPDEADPVRRLRWRRADPGGLPKVACRWRDDLVIEQGNHGARYTETATFAHGLLEVRHFPYRSAEQFVRKAVNGKRAYDAATELSQDAGAHWRLYGELIEERGPDAGAAWFRQWFFAPDPAAGLHGTRLVEDPAV